MSMFDDVLGMGRTSIFEGAYEPEVEEITLESAPAIPDYMDPMEFMTQVACEQEMNMHRLDMAILGEEYLYLRENGTEMVNETASIQGVVDKFKKGIDWLWEKITSFFKEVQKKFDEAIKLDDRFLAAYQEKAKKVNRIKIESAMSDSDITNPKATYVQANYWFGGITKNVASIYNNLESYGADDTVDKILADARSDIFKAKRTDESSTAKAIMKGLYGDKKGNTSDRKPEPVELEVQKVITAFKESKKCKEDIKKAYSDNKKAINAMYKGAKKIESISKKYKVLSTDQSKNIHKGVKAINALGKDLTIVNKYMVKVMNLKRSLLKKAIVKAAARGSESIQKANKTAKDESASLIESVQIGGEW